MSLRSFVTLWVLFCLCLIPSEGLGQTLTAEQIQQAITLGTSKARFRPPSVHVSQAKDWGIRLANCSASAASRNYLVLVVGPGNLITAHAALAKTKYQPMQASNVTEDMLVPEIRVVVYPVDSTRSVFARTTARSGSPPLSPTHVILRDKTTGKVTQPIGSTITAFPLMDLTKQSTSATNPGTVTITEFNISGAIASFSPADVPQNEFDVIIVNGLVDAICKISMKERTNIW